MVDTVEPTVLYSTVKCLKHCPCDVLAYATVRLAGQKKKSLVFSTQLNLMCSLDGGSLVGQLSTTTFLLDRPVTPSNQGSQTTIYHGKTRGS